MSQAIGFDFPNDVSGQWDGFNESGMEHFTGSPLEHLGREVPQNTIDARDKPPAQIHIKLLTVPTVSVPGIEDLTKVLHSCLKESVKESDKAHTFFKNAVKLISAKTMNVLQISDYNTTGVAGPCVNGTPFFAMMKAMGQSKKSNTAGGSYGIGKLAPFTVSSLRTVFLTTVWKDDSGVRHHYAQGKSILMSHLDGRSITRRGTGFWGIKGKCLPVESVALLPSWLRRQTDDISSNGKMGTTLSILGFTGNKNWKDALAANIAGNFFGALKDGLLEVEIGDSLVIDKSTLASVLENNEIGASLSNQKRGPERFANARSYMRAISDDVEVKVEETEDLHLGKCSLKMLIGEGLPRKVAVLRNGMLITDELARLKRFSSYKEFVAVLECHSEKGLDLLRAMEPPRHDDFEPDRLSPERQHTGRVALKEITDWVRQMLDRHAKDPVSEVTTLDEMADFFGDEDEAGSGKQQDENLKGDLIIRQRPVKFKARSTDGGALYASSSTGDDAGADLNEGEDDETDGGVHSNADDEKGGKGGSVDRKLGEAPGSGKTAVRGRRVTPAGVDLRDVRAVPTSSSTRRVAFTPTTTGTINIEVQDSGADANYFLEVQTSNLGCIVEGRIDGINTVAGERVTINVEFAHAFDGTIRIVANAV